MVSYNPRLSHISTTPALSITWGDRLTGWPVLDQYPSLLEMLLLWGQRGENPGQVAGWLLRKWAQPLPGSSAFWKKKKKATSFVLPLINFCQLLKVNDLASRDSQITGAAPPLSASVGHLSVTFIYWINPPVSSRRTTAKWPLIVGWCADETSLQRDCKPLFLPLLLLSLRDQQ